MCKTHLRLTSYYCLHLFLNRSKEFNKIYRPSKAFDEGRAYLFTNLILFCFAVLLIPVFPLFHQVFTLTFKYTHDAKCYLFICEMLKQPIYKLHSLSESFYVLLLHFHVLHRHLNIIHKHVYQLLHVCKSS